MSQLSFLSLAVRKELRCEKFLSEMDEIVPWERWIERIRTHYPTGKGGRPPHDLELMLRIHCLQQWHGLSDPAVEEAIYDRNSFQKFLKIDLLSDHVPDESAVLRFRHLLEAHGLAKEMFAVVQDYLAEHGLILKEGTAVDATLIAAPSSTKNAAKARDPEMSSTKKGNRWYFGMKAHIGVQSKGKPFIHSIETTTAKVSDKAKMDALVHGEENNVFGDKGYFDEENKRKARQDGVFYGVLDRARRNRPLSASQKKRNKKCSRVRSKVEHPFQIVKCQWNYRKTRYRGLAKNTGQILTLFGLANLFMARKSLLSAL